MKRCLSALLALFMLVMPCMTAVAVDSGIVVSIGNVSAQAGETVEVTVELSENSGFSYLEIRLDFDTDVLTLNSVTNESSARLTKGLNNTKLVWDASEDNTDIGNFATLSFTVSDSAEPGDYKLSLKKGVANNWDEENVAVSYAAGIVSVSTAACAHSNPVHMEAVEPACHYTGNVEHWYCNDCETVWTDEALTQISNHLSVILPALGGEVIHVDAVAPSCGYNGNIEYWYCETCEQVWQDEALIQLTNRMNVIVPAAEHNIIHMDAVEPACHYTGNVEHWYCTVCETVWTDEALTQISNHLSVILPALGGEVIHVDAVAPSCGYNGNIEYWYCETCEQVWQDEALTRLTNRMNVILPATEHNIVHMDAVEPGCHYTGNVEHWYCTVCETVWTDEALTQISNHLSVILPALGGNVEHVDAKDATCYENGNIEYWYCETCEQVWQDEALTQLTNRMSVIAPAVHGMLVHMDAVEPACHYTGNVEHWICYMCNTVWTDEALTQISNIKNVILPELGGTVVHVEAKAPTCYENGNNEHWYCEECGQVWQDEARIQLTNRMNVIVPASHGMVVHMDAVEPACHYTGSVEYWICYMCNTVWTDEALTQISNVKNVTIPELGGNVVHVEAVAPDCYANGNIEYWYCEECGQVWQDEERTRLTNRMNVILPATEHNIVHMDAVEPGCHYTGNVEHWYCTICETVWADEALTQITNHKNVILPELGGDVVHVDAVAPSCGYEGNIEYWYCVTCEQVWQDEARTRLTNFKNVILPAAEHALVHVEAVAPNCYENGNIEHWYCTVCETVWQNKELTQITNHLSVILPATGHELIYFEAIAPGCHYNGNIEYWFCPDCECFWQDKALTQLTNSKSVILPAVGSDNVVHVEAVAPDCCTEGNIEYWFCPDCEQYWQNEALTQLTNSKRVVLPTADHSIVHIDAVEPGCHYTGNVEHWYCTDCETVWTDEALTRISNHKNVILPELGGNVIHVEAKAPTCYENGNIEHWYCETCEQVWQDEARIQLTNRMNVIVPASHGLLVHMDAVEPGCHYTGNVEHWICYICNTVWTDEALTQVSNVKNVILPELGGNVIHFDAVTPGCHSNGNIEYWYCTDCEQFWQDEALTQPTNSKRVILPATGSENLVHMEAVEPGCHYTGNIEYWHCPDCEGFWTDAACTKVTNSKSVILPELGGNVIHVEAKAPTCYENGNIEHWYCEECEQFWQDEARTKLTNSKNVIIPAYGYIWGDIDADGDVDAKDYVILKKYIIGTYSLEGVDERGDLNNDGKVDARDYVALKRYFLSK